MVRASAWLPPVCGPPQRPLRGFGQMNLNEVNQHIGECISSLTTNNYPEMKIVVLIHNNNDDISMISNSMETRRVLEVLTRSMVSYFDPVPRPEFKLACHKFIDTIQPAVSSLSNDAAGVVCFWDDRIKSAAMISSLDNYLLSFAIICEHIFRTISGNITYSAPENYLLH